MKKVLGIRTMDKFGLLFRLMSSGDARAGGGDSFSDQLSCAYTVYFLGCAAIGISAKYYLDAPIKCWTPSFFTDAFDAYTDQVGTNFRQLLDLSVC